MSIPSLDSVNYTLAIFGIVTMGVGWWRGWFESPAKRKKREQDKAVADAILGEPPIKDRNETVITPGQPGLVHRVATVEEAVVEFRHLVGIVTETQHMVTEVRQEMGQIIGRIQNLEDIRVDKLIGQVESAHMWRAVADNAANDIDEG